MTTPQPAIPLTTETAPGTLLRRAHAALVERGAGLTTEEMIAVVFGATPTPGGSPWRQLLSKVLGDSDLFQRREDGAWSLAEWSAATTPLEAVEFVVLDVETTGLSPARHRLIEVAAIIIQGDTTLGTFQELIHPGRKIPDFITRFTGISNEMVRGAPKAEQVLPRLQTFLGQRIIVGHNVSFDLGFLSYEARRGQWFFPTVGLDTITLTRRFVPGAKRMKLDVLAAKLGVRAHDRHRALGDAQTTADVLRILIARARESGCRTLGDLRAALAPQDKERAKNHSQTANPRPTGNLYLNPAWRRDFPDKPGVYLMRDELGKVIYVGKAKRLRERLASYYNHPMGYTRKMDGLLQSVRSIETRVLGSELEALLVESQLIKELQPRYNVQLRNYEMYPFIKVDVANDFPRVFATREVHADGGRYFGPFNSRSAVDATIEIIQKIFPVRTCVRSLPPAAKPSDACLRYHMGRCAAPCRGGVTRAAYRPVIDEVLEFLGGGRDDLIEKLQAMMWRAAERDDFERAASLRDALRQVDHVLLGQQLITGAIEANNLLIAYPSATPGHAELFLVRHGRLVAQQRVAGDEAALRGTLVTLIQRAIWLGPPPTRVGKQEVDQINIISRWVHRHSQDHGRAFWTLPAALDDPAVAGDFIATVIAGVVTLVAQPLDLAPDASPDDEPDEERTARSRERATAATSYPLDGETASR